MNTYLQVSELTHYGLPSIAINKFTPDNSALWKNGHIPRFARLLHDPKWAKNVGLLQVDEAHFIVTTGTSDNKKGPFRPAFTDLGERARVHLPVSTPCAAYSASTPPQISNIVMRTLRMEPDNTVTIELTTNRPNLVHAVIPMIGSLDNLSNLDFPIPNKCKCMVFVDNKKKAGQIERYLNSKYPPSVAAKKPFRQYHSSMSKDYLETTAKAFKQEISDIQGLITTSAALNGFDVPNVRLVVLYGIPNDPFELDQRGEMGAHDLAASDLEYTPGKKEQRTKPDILTYTRCKTGRRRQLANNNNDFTAGAATEFTSRWCCDNCGSDVDPFDLLYYPIGPCLIDDDAVEQRAPLIERLETWRSQTHMADPVTRNFPIEYILEDASISLLARGMPGSFRTPAEITDFLDETPDWHEQHALDILALILQYDQDPYMSDSDSTSDTSSNSGDASENESDSSLDPDAAPRPSLADTEDNVPIRPASPASSISSVNSSRPPTLDQTATGRPLRRAAANHLITGISDRMSNKRQKL
ncbi:P-loop containing nucleoside triphosphate hydrolase protein [Mycena rebaudengoi]|nr:P-loop containing nucleoside triphosphate hydrolase protein [Mycena rebaudengoi]